MRKFLQALSLLLFSALFFFATYRLPDWLPADIYLRLDPLLGLNAVFVFFAAVYGVPVLLLTGSMVWGLVLCALGLARLAASLFFVRVPHPSDCI